MALKPYHKDQLWKIFQQLPAELQEAIFSEENANYIYSICKAHNISEDNISTVAKIVGRTLLGLLPPETIPETLQTELGLEEKTATQMFYEINRFILHPVKSYLNEIYHIKPKTPPAPPEKTTFPEPETKTTTEQKQPYIDIYREPIEE